MLRKSSITGFHEVLNEIKVVRSKWRLLLFFQSSYFYQENSWQSLVSENIDEKKGEVFNKYPIIERPVIM